MTSFRFALLLFTFLLTFVLLPQETLGAEATVGADGSIDQPSQEALTIAASLMGHGASGLREEDALGMAELIFKVKNDAETKKMLTQMVKDNFADFAALQKQGPKEMVQQMTKAYEELKMIEVLFQDPQKAVRLMEEEGLLPAEHLAKYRNDPSLLEQDTRKGMYFQFVAVAHAAGYLEK